MKIARLLAGGAAATAVLGLMACAVGPNYRPPRPDVPAAFTAAAGTATPLDLASWWRSLDDSELDSLVERAVKSNFDVEIALTRLQQARTYEAVVAGHALPEVDASAAHANGTGSDLARGRALQPLVSADNASGLQNIDTLAGFDAVWEIDLFGKYRRALQAARFDAQAAAAVRYGVIVTLVADVVRAYVDLRGDQIQAKVLKQARDVLKESLRIVTIRYERGITNELDVALATRELQTLESEIAPAEAQANAAEYAIAALLGVYPETIDAELKAPQMIPVMPAAAAPGVPLDLLKRRPDVLQAERELAASTARIGVATANLFPQLALVGSIGAQQGPSTATAATVGKHVWSFGPAAVWPLLDFGALDAEVDIADLETHASLANYRKTIVNAVREVDSAIDAYGAQQARLQDLGLAMAAGQRAVDLATARYDRGLTDYLNVVDAERLFYQLQLQYVAAQMAEGGEFVNLYRSLGGGWQNFGAVPPIRQPQPAVIAAFRRVLEGNAAQ